MSSTVISVLPKFIALKSNSNQKYLRYVHEKVETHGFLQFCGDGALSPFSRLEVVPAATKGLVHIRCCYNNKYWARSSKNHWWIVAGADEPEEDQSKWSCTLFAPEVVKGDKPNTTAVRFRHVQLGHYAALSDPEAVPPYHSCMLARQTTGSRTSNKGDDVYTIHNLEAELILPKYVSFQADNSRYVALRTIEHHPYLECSATDRWVENAATEITTIETGNLVLKNVYNDRYWNRSPNWIWAEISVINPDHLDMQFQAVKVEDNNILALRNLGNNYYCKRLTADGKTSCLNAGISSITKEARLIVEELVKSRTIDGVTFNTNDARFYDAETIELDSGVAINTSYDTKILEIPLSYNLTYTSSWDRSVPIFGSINPSTATLKSKIPTIGDGGQIQMLDEFDGDYRWGETYTREVSKNQTEQVAVLPRTLYRIRVVATKGSCDIPFSYTQKDLFGVGGPGGTTVTEEKVDGIYTCTNIYNIKKIGEEEHIN